MTYKNPRLKHVKKIEDIAMSVGHWSPSVRSVAKQILYQCNLLLETKKKKCITCGGKGIWKNEKCVNCGYVGTETKPSPQPDCNCKEIGNVCFHSKTSPQPEKESKACLKCGGYKPDNEEIFSCSKICLCLEPEIGDVINSLERIEKKLDGRKCKWCGHTNNNGAIFCESCADDMDKQN